MSEQMLENPVVVTANNIVVSKSNTSQTNVPQFTFNLGGVNPTAKFRLHTLAFSFPSVFQAKYSYMVEISGVTLYTGSLTGNTAQLPDATTGIYSIVPDGKSFLLPKGAVINVYAYNTGSSNSDTTMSITLVFDIITPDVEKGV